MGTQNLTLPSRWQSFPGAERRGYGEYKEEITGNQQYLSEMYQVPNNYPVPDIPGLIFQYVEVTQSQCKEPGPSWAKKKLTIKDGPGIW